MQESITYDYISIDGSHVAKDVLLDAVFCWQLLRPEGVMFFDDYGGGDPTSIGWPRIGVDAFVQCHADELETLHRGYHYVVRKKK